MSSASSGRGFSSGWSFRYSASEASHRSLSSTVGADCSPRNATETPKNNKLNSRASAVRSIGGRCAWCAWCWPCGRAWCCACRVSFAFLAAFDRLELGSLGRPRGRRGGGASGAGGGGGGGAAPGARWTTLPTSAAASNSGGSAAPGAAPGSAPGAAPGAAWWSIGSLASDMIGPFFTLHRSVNCPDRSLADLLESRRPRRRSAPPTSRSRKKITLKPAYW